ncbi:MAG: arylsulfatase AtsA [Ginsengibacter sp.]
MKKITCAFLMLSLLSFQTKKEVTYKKSDRPNILLIVADDLGYTDLGCFGGDINTPNIDQLAAKGLLFTRFHTAPLCAPTRSMILSGNNNHVAGIGSMFPVDNTSRQGKPGYEHHLSDRIVTVAQLLKEGGYQTFMAGKWHVGSGSRYIPYAKGFEKSFALLDGGANHFGNNAIFENSPPQYREDEKTVPFPEGRFSSDVYTEKMIGYIKNKQKDKPFFAYISYTAPHWPLQVPDEYLENYKGKYDMGYDSLRVLRFEHQKAIGLFPANSKLPPRLSSIKLWQQLTAEEKKTESKKMELYAAMVDNLDRQVGEVVQFLRDTKQLDNTLIVFMADNGAAGEDFYNHPGFGPFIRKHYDNSYENMGKTSSFVSYGPQWAQVSAAPFKLFKEYPTEGGINTPLIISGNGVNRSPGIENVFINVMDLAPTFLEIAHISYPEMYNNKKVMPIMGESFLPFIQGKSKKIHDENYVSGLEHYGGCLLIKGNWKITNTSDPFDETAFELYKIDEDWGETNDLSKSEPKKLKEMMNEWTLFKNKVGIIPLDKGERIHLDIIR